MPYRLKLKQPDFEPVEGPYANKKFNAGEIYQDIPREFASRFEEIKVEAPKTVVLPASDQPPAKEANEKAEASKNPKSNVNTGGDK